MNSHHTYTGEFSLTLTTDFSNLWKHCYIHSCFISHSTKLRGLPLSAVSSHCLAHYLPRRQHSIVTCSCSQGCSGAGTRGNGIPTHFSRLTLTRVWSSGQWLVFWVRSHTTFVNTTPLAAAKRILPQLEVNLSRYFVMLLLRNKDHQKFSSLASFATCLCKQRSAHEWIASSSLHHTRTVNLDLVQCEFHTGK